MVEGILIVIVGYPQWSWLLWIRSKSNYATASKLTSDHNGFGVSFDAGKGLANLTLISDVLQRAINLAACSNHISEWVSLKWFRNDC